MTNLVAGELDQFESMTDNLRQLVKTGPPDQVVPYSSQVSDQRNKVLVMVRQVAEHARGTLEAIEHGALPTATAGTPPTTGEENEPRP